MKEWEKIQWENRASSKKEVSVVTVKGLAGTQGMGREKGRIPSKTRKQDFALSSSSEYGFTWLNKSSDTICYRKPSLNIFHFTMD